MNDGWSFETRQIHAGQAPDGAVGARALPIYQTTSFVFRDAEHAANLFALKELGNIYTRIMNPTQDAVEQRIASLEGGVGALLVASGQAAETIAILNLAENGDHIVSSPQPVRRHLQPLPLHPAEARHRGVVRRGPRRPRLVAGRRPAEHQGLLRRDHLQPQAGRARHRGRGRRRARGRRPADRRQHRRHARTSSRPFEWGADVVVHSTTKYLGGHGTSHRRRRSSTPAPSTTRSTPSASRTSTSPTPATTASSTRATSASAAPFGANLSFILKARVQLLRDIGPAMSPFNAFLLAQGHRDPEPADRAARRRTPRRWRSWLQGRDEVECGRLRRAARAAPGTPRRRSTRREAPGAVLAFEIKGGIDAGRRFVDALAAAQPRREHRRRAQPGDPPCVDHPQPALARRSSWRPASPRAWSGCRSASSTSTTSSPISRPGSPRRRPTECSRPRRSGGRGTSA